MDQKPSPDPLLRIKYLGYSLAKLSSAPNMSDFVRYAKFQLCVRTKRLMKDPIWDTYTKEEILVEFYALKFDTDKKYLQEFEVQLLGLPGATNDFSDWADREMAKEAKMKEHTLDNMEQRVEFNPADIMGEDGE